MTSMLKTILILVMKRLHNMKTWRIKTRHSCPQRAVNPLTLQSGRSHRLFSSAKRREERSKKKIQLSTPSKWWRSCRKTGVSSLKSRSWATRSRVRSTGQSTRRNGASTIRARAMNSWTAILSPRVSRSVDKSELTNKWRGRNLKDSVKSLSFKRQSKRRWTRLSERSVSRS